MDKTRAKRAGETLAGAIVQGAEITGRTLRQPLQPERVAQQRYWVWAVVVGLLWHAAWFTTLTRQGISPRNYRSPPTQLAYLALPADFDGARSAQEDVLRVWSPALFALPTSLGFSGGATEQRLGTKPPLDPPVGPAFFMEYPASSRPRAVESKLDEKVQTAFALLQDAPTVDADEPVFLPTEVRTSAGLSVSFLGELAKLYPEGLRLPLPQDLEAGSWVAEVEMSVSPEGEVDHVFLVERAPEPPIDRHVVRALRALRFEPQEGPLAGRARIHYAQVVSGEERP